jgi:hypothetical protein
MFDLRKKLLIGISIVVGILIVIILGTMFFSDSNKEQKKPVVTETQDIDDTDDYVEKETVLSGAPAPEDSGELYARQSARLFVERFLSYSNQNNNQHIEDVQDFATARMQRWMETQKIDGTGDYAGTTTKVIYSNVTTISATAATVEIGIQQIYQAMDGTDINTKEGRVEMIKNGNSWLVDGLFLN